MLYGRGFIPLAAIIIGIGLVFNCLRAILNREDVYDQDSSNQMLIANTIGVIIGVCLLLGAWWWLSGGLASLLGRIIGS